MIRTLIVDEPLARDLLRSYIAMHADIDFIGEAADGISAARLIGELSPDLCCSTSLFRSTPAWKYCSPQRAIQPLSSSRLTMRLQSPHSSSERLTICLNRSQPNVLRTHLRDFA